MDNVHQNEVGKCIVGHNLVAVIAVIDTTRWRRDATLLQIPHHSDGLFISG